MSTDQAPTQYTPPNYNDAAALIAEGRKYLFPSDELNSASSKQP
jgi:hypothetical protein